MNFVLISHYALFCQVVASLWRNRSSLWRIWRLYILILPLTHLVLLSYYPDNPALLVAGRVVLASYLSWTVQRLFLAGEIIHHHGQRPGFQLFLFLFVPIWLLPHVAAPLVAFLATLGTVQLWQYPLWYAVFGLMLLIPFARILLVLPPLVLEKPLSFKAAWQAGQGRTIALATAVLLFQGPALLLQWRLAEWTVSGWWMRIVTSLLALPVFLLAESLLAAMLAMIWAERQGRRLSV